jgi:hypothetical protein
VLDVKARDDGTEVDARALRHGNWFDGYRFNGHCSDVAGRVYVFEFSVLGISGSCDDAIYAG